MAMEANAETHMNKQLEMEKTNDNLCPCLPHDILRYNLLQRVPIKSLIRFRCVCKQWCNIISDLNQPCLLCINYATQNDLLYFHSFVCKRTNQIPKEDGLGDEKKSIEYSLNGLLLITSRPSGALRQNYQVYNPITGRSTILPPLDRHPCFYLFGMAYDSIIAKYKVVCCASKELQEYSCKIVTVGVEGNKWRDILIPRPHRLRQYQPVYANGSVHWMISRNTKVMTLHRYDVIHPESDGKILCLDVNREIFYTIRHPKQSSDSGVYSLLEMRGLLCFVDHVSNTRLKLWVLKEVDLENKKLEWMEEGDYDLTEYLERGDKPNFHGFLVNSFPFAILTKPKFKIIIMCFHSGKNETVKMFYSYDVELNQFDNQSINFSRSPYYNESGPFELARFCPFWHVNSLTYF